MGTILFVRLEPRAVEALRGRAGDLEGAVLEETSLDALEDRLARRGAEADVLLLGSGVADPIRAAQRAHARDDDLAVLVLCPPADVARTRQAIQLSPFLGVEVHCVPAAEPSVLIAEVAHAAAATRQRRLYRAAVASLSDRREAESVPAPRVRFLDRLLEMAPIGILTLDAEGFVLGANEKALALLDGCHAEIAGFPLAEQFPEAQRALLRTWLLECAGADRAAPTRVWERRLGDGRRLLLEANASPIDEGAARMVVLLHDVTESHLAGEELARARRRADAAVRAKDRLLANVGHEVRTPMNIIIGMIDMALDAEVSAAQREYLALARRSTEQLLALVDEILDLSHIEADELHIEAAEFEPRAALQSVSRTFAVQAEQKGLSFVSEIDASVPERVVGDAARLVQVVASLVGNALKFTDRGYVALRLSAEPGAGDALLLRGEVADSGIGISAESLDRIFEPFEQGDGTSTRRHGGTGLGLAICRRLIEAMEGRLTAESLPEKGSTFRFTLAVRRAAAAAAAAAEPPPSPSADATRGPRRTAGLRVLVAEDNPANQVLVRRVLEGQGHSARIVSTGREALEAIERDDYDLVLMDVQMPEMDGLQATSAIRAAERGTGRHLPIIAVTAHAMRGDEERCLAAGVDAYIAKPARPRDLLEVIERVVRSSPA